MAKRRRTTPAWVQQPLYLAIRAAIAALSTGDLEATARGAARMGRRFAAASFNRTRLARAEENLAVAFPSWSPERRRDYAIKAYEHLFTLAVEMAYTPRLLSEDGWSDRVRLGNLGESVRHLLRGRACVLITGHSGNWELLGYTMALLGFPMHAIYRPLDLKPLDAWLADTRQRRGLILLDKFGAMEAVPRLVGAGAALGFVADQNGGDRGLFVPFFNRLASAYKSIGFMALKYDTPILCGVARRLVWGQDTTAERMEADDHEGRLGFQTWSGEAFRYRIEVMDVITPDDWADQPDPLFYITARYRRAIEAMVRRAPEQYLWMHRYWKSRPRHERLGRPFPGHLREKIEQLPWTTPEDVRRILEWSERDARTLHGSTPGAAVGER